MLGTVFFALAAADTIPGPGMGLGQVVVVDHLGGHVTVQEQGKIFRDRNVPGTLHCAVATACTWDRKLPLDDPGCLGAKCLLLLIHGTEILHGADIVLQLLHAVHAGKHHHDAFVAGGKT